MVILRDFAASDPPQWSVLEFIEHRLRTFYQCPPTSSIIHRLLLTGGAFIIFDGLDELIDTSRRAEVSAIIEQFCIEYPLAQVLVTSRIVGYDEARLDEKQFRTLRIDDFDDSRVSDYVRKWFLQETGIAREEAIAMASALLDESSTIRDLRSNPLMLALICILYRGERSIPQSRADVYEKCADLLFRKWDARRKIYVELRARHLVEPAVRYLAYWMLTRDSAQANVTRRQLISEAATYFQSRGFDELHDAEAAAEEFVDFCRGRAWVFTDVGSTATGEQLYAFTHRTFLEYFAAYYLAGINVSPETLARALAPKVARGEWDMVGQLAVQMKDRSIERGGERVFIELLGEKRKRTVKNRLNMLGFLARCLSAVQPRPSIVRELATNILDLYLGSADHFDPIRLDPLQALLENWQESTEPVASVILNKVRALLSTGYEPAKAYALELACCLPELIFSSNKNIWAEFAAANKDTFASEIRSMAASNDAIWWVAVTNKVIPSDTAIHMLDNDLTRLFRIRFYEVFGFGLNSPIFEMLRQALSIDTSELELFSSLGRYLFASPDWPKVFVGDVAGRGVLFSPIQPSADELPSESVSAHLRRDESAYLGILFCLAIAAEASEHERRDYRQISTLERNLASIAEFAPYIVLRLGGRPRTPDIAQKFM